MMASKSRSAQEQLAELEKASAPFADQLVEAAKFIGEDLDPLTSHSEDVSETKKTVKSTVYHGREEWLLRWLLKKLQAPKDNVPRQQPSSWWLFLYLIRTIPLPIVARLLIEKKFMTILRQTLDETLKRTKGKEATDANTILQSSPEQKKQSSKKSKKRKRSPELISDADGTNGGLFPLLESIHATLHFVVQSTSPAAGVSDQETTGSFLAEYMKTATRTSAQESAEILGLWLSLSTELLNTRENSIKDIASWIPPFIEIWQVRAADESGLVLFSLHTTQSLLQLLRAVKRQQLAVPNLKAQLEQLIARNIMIPARSANAEDNHSVMLETLTRIPVIQETDNAPLLFDVAIRSIQSHGSRWRRPQDDAWLQTVFITLHSAFVPQRHEANSKALCSMLRSAIKFKVDLDLPTLSKITSQYALTDDRPDWTLLAELIQLDANIFLIPDAELDLLNKLLTGITKSSLEKDWTDIADQIVLDVCVPLMAEFSKARDLSGFIRHWYAQLVEFEKLRKESRLFSMETFSAWEDDALQGELGKLLEPSLTAQQTTQLLDWLTSEADEHPNAVSVILQAISGSISQEEFVDTVNISLCGIMFKDGRWGKLDVRYSWRCWRIVSQSLQWLMRPHIDELFSLLEEQAKPFKALMSKASSATLLDIYGGNTVSLDGLEMLRCGCALWSSVEIGNQSEGTLRSMMFRFIMLLYRDIKAFPQDLLGDTDLGQTVCGSRQNTLYRDIGWTVWSLVRCILVEYPKVLEFASEMKGEGEFEQILQIVFWLCSASTREADNKIDWLRLNSEAFPDIWIFILQSDTSLDRPAIIEKMLDIMLADDSNICNPLIKSRSLNTFAIQSLLQLPLEIFSKRNREQVMIKWSPVSEEASAEKTEESKLVPADPAVLSLKIKIMQRPTFYEDMSFRHLATLANIVADPEIESPDISLQLFKELVRQTLSQMTENMDQSRNKAYIAGALSDIKVELSPHESKTDKRLSYSKLSYATIALIDVALSVLRNKATSLNDLDIISSSKLRKLSNGFKEYLLSHLEILVAKLAKGSSSKRKSGRAGYHLALICALDALSTLGVTSSDLATFTDKAKVLTTSKSFMADSSFDTGRKLESFLAAHSTENKDANFVVQVKGDISTVDGRRSILETTHVATAGKDHSEKLKLLESILGEELTSLTQLDKLLAAREIIRSCEDVRKSPEGEADENDFDLSVAYSILCGHLWKATGVRQFCLISETMELMLQTKARSMTQWNIDNTLGSITIMCSRNGPALNPKRAGTIYLHLCHLMQAILTSHRLKLQGHFHLVVQVIQTLLRCLFTPLPHSTTKTTKFLAPPPWLSSPKHQLTAKHAEAYTRLITMICDPTVSSVTRSNHNSLTSATAKAKGMAAQHMQFALTTYVKLQLEMRMLPELRERMIPGLYAILDTTTPEMRRMINDGLDASGRAVFVGLFRDYMKFGKWKGT